MNGLMMLLGGLCMVGGEEKALAREVHMPPLPLELRVMLEWRCLVVRISSGPNCIRSRRRTCCVLGRPVISAVICSRYERVAPIGARSLYCCPSIQSTSGIQLVVSVEEDSRVGEKMGGTDVGNTLITAV